MTGSDETEPHPLGCGWRDQSNKLKNAEVSPTSWTKLYLQLEKTTSAGDFGKIESCLAFDIFKTFQVWFTQHLLLADIISQKKKRKLTAETWTWHDGYWLQLPGKFNSVNSS